MAFANSSYSDILATTIESRSRELADNVTNNNATLAKLRERGNVRTVSGGSVILEEIMYTDAATQNVNSYSGYETLNIQPNSPISAAQLNMKQYAAAVTMSGLEMLQNSGKEQMIDLMEGRLKVAEGQLLNRISTDIYGDGTGNGGKNLDGLALIISNAPTSGTYAGINRATWSFWQNQRFRCTTTGGAAVSATNIQNYLNRSTALAVRNSDSPDLYVMDNTMWSFFTASMQAIQRVTNEKMAGLGFASMKYYGGGVAADVVLDGGVSGNAGVANASSGAIAGPLVYLINTKYLHFRPHRDRNFVPIGGERQSVNQDAIVKLIGWAGNLTCSSPRLQVLMDNT
jgi:hypothetical protein